MIARDKNHPCVVMWSIANEPGLDGDGKRPQQAYDYFRPLYELAHASDPQNRPVTLVCCQTTTRPTSPNEPWMWCASTATTAGTT